MILLNTLSKASFACSLPPSLSLGITFLSTVNCYQGNWTTWGTQEARVPLVSGLCALPESCGNFGAAKQRTAGGSEAAGTVPTAVLASAGSSQGHGRTGTKKNSAKKNHKCCRGRYSFSSVAAITQATRSVYSSFSHNILLVIARFSGHVWPRPTFTE